MVFIVTIIILGKINSLRVFPRNKIVLSSFINIILAYSPIKNRANGAPAYSTLYPDTSSDSPSARSKGVRFVSAKDETIHVIKRGKHGITNHIPSLCILRKDNSLHPPTINISGSSINPNLTS